MNITQKYTNNFLSVIIRCHKEERLNFLDEALFSLSIQYWQDLEVVVVLQNASEKFKYQVQKLIEKQPFHKSCKFEIYNVEIPIGIDGRSSLLNYGISNSTGRYLAFLDDDDVVYQHGYKTLIEQIKFGNAAVAVGGCRTAKVKKNFGNLYIQKKESPFTWGRNRFDLIKDNFIPIHSYIMDRYKIDELDIYFNDEFPPLEDYDFLLRLISKYEFDFSKLNVFVCEYRHHGSNSLPVYDQNSTLESVKKYNRAFQLIEERKKTISFNLTIPEIQELLSNNSSDIKNTEDIVLSSNSKSPESIQTEVLEVSNNNPQIIRKVFSLTGDKIYKFFSRYPYIEKQLSKTVHFGWRLIAKFSDSSTNN